MSEEERGFVINWSKLLEAPARVTADRQTNTGEGMTLFHLSGHATPLIAAAGTASREGLKERPRDVNRNTQKVHI